MFEVYALVFMVCGRGIQDIKHDGEPIVLEVEGKVAQLRFIGEDRIACTVPLNLLQVWNLKEQKKERTYKHKASVMGGFAFSQKKETFLLAEVSGRIQEVKGDQLTPHGKPQPLETVCFAVSPSGKRCGMGQRLFSDGKWYVHVLDLDGFAEVANLYGPTGVIRSIAFSEKDTRVAVLGKELLIFDLTNGKEEKRIEIGDAPWGVWVEFCPRRNLFAYSFGNETVLMSTENYKVVKTWSKPDGGGYFRFSADGRRIALGGNLNNENVTSLWNISDVGDITQEGTFKGHSKLVVTLEFSPDGSRLATGSADGTIRVWPIGNKKDKKD